MTSRLKLLVRNSNLCNHFKSKIQYCPVRTISSSQILATLSRKSLSNEEFGNFKAVLPNLIKELTYEGVHKDMPNVNEHLSKCIEYNLPDGKLTRGTTVPLTLKLLFPNQEISKEQFQEACILGWCTEFMQAFFLVADDIMDGSKTRRGKDCWYKNKEIGMIAINDFIFLETCIYTLLHNHFRGKGYYLNLLDCFLYTTRHTAMGQALDLMSEDKSRKLEDFTMHRYSQIVQYKTSYYSFYLPVQLGMILAGIKDPEIFRKARSILLAIGHYFQVQDDFLDCFGDPKVTGKIGTDIQDGKCSWLIVTAIQLASGCQIDVLKQNYGQETSEAISKVKEVYEELGLRSIYSKFEEDSYQDIVSQIGQISIASQENVPALNHEIFESLLSKIYKRSL